MREKEIIRCLSDIRWYKIPLSCSFLFWISFMASVTYRAAASAFELEIAGTILPAISLILK